MLDKYISKISGVSIVGGEGKRLRPFTTSKPKALLPVGVEMKPMLEFTIKPWVELGIKNYLRKPIRQSDLLYTIMKTLGKEQEQEIDEQKKTSAEVSMPQLRILLAEDNIVNQKVAASMLEKMGHDVTVANDGEEAIALLQEQMFDLVLMDVQMPNMNGIEATRKIRTSTASNMDLKIPIIAMTAHAMKGDREQFLEAGMDDYISKPINVDELKKVLKKIVMVNVGDMEM